MCSKNLQWQAYFKIEMEGVNHLPNSLCFSPHFLISLCRAEQLGARLEVEGKGSLSLNAQLCYICAGNLNKLVESWTAADKTDTPAKMQHLVELVMLLRKAVEQQGRTVEVSGKLAELLSCYAAMLASQGHLTAALTYLQNSENVSSLDARFQVFMAVEIQVEVLQVVTMYSVAAGYPTVAQSRRPQLLKILIKIYRNS